MATSCGSKKSRWKCTSWIAESWWWPFISWCQLEHFLGGTWRRWKMRDGPNMMVMMASMIFLSLNISSIPHCASRFLRAYDGTIAFHLSDLSTLGFESFGAIFFSGAVALACFKSIRKWQLDRLASKELVFQVVSWPRGGEKSCVGPVLHSGRRWISYLLAFRKACFALFALWI